jgi:hypothetical protein
MYETQDNPTIRKFYVLWALLNWRIFLKQQHWIKLGPNVALSNHTRVSVILIRQVEGHVIIVNPSYDPVKAYAFQREDVSLKFGVNNFLPPLSLQFTQYTHVLTLSRPPFTGWSILLMHIVTFVSMLFFVSDIIGKISGGKCFILFFMFTERRRCFHVQYAEKPLTGPAYWSGTWELTQVTLSLSLCFVFLSLLCMNSYNLQSSRFSLKICSFQSKETSIVCRARIRTKATL